MNTISQSLIRDMLKEQGYCGHYLNLVYNQGCKFDPTPAMLEGLVFEQAILGSTRDNIRYEIPKLKSGEKSKAGKDLDRVIEWASHILTVNGIEFTECQAHKIEDNRHGHIDAIGTYQGQPYLFDLKYTGMSYNQWERERKWSELTAHFTLQARHYQSLNGQLPFMFLVFGDGWCRFFEVPYIEEDIAHHIEVASEALETFNAMDYRPTTDSRLCFECPMKGVCTVSNSTIQIESL